MRRMLLEKTGRAVWMSHLDFMRLMQRAFRRAGVVLHHSQGFTPHAYVSMLLPLSTGVESVCEIMEYELEQEMALDAQALNAVLPEGVRVLKLYESDRKAKYLTHLQAELHLEYDGEAPAPETIAELFRRPTLMVEKRTKRGMEETDILPMLRSVQVEREAGGLRMDCVVCAQNPALNPLLLVSAVERYLPDCRPDFVRSRRVEIFEENGEVFR